MGTVRVSTPLTGAGRSSNESGGVEMFVSILNEIREQLTDIRQRLSATHKAYYTVEELAELTGRSQYTIRRWISEGRIQATRVKGTGSRGRLLVARTQLNELIGAGQGAGIPDVATV